MFGIFQVVLGFNILIKVVILHKKNYWKKLKYFSNFSLKFFLNIGLKISSNELSMHVMTANISCRNFHR